MTNPRQLVPGPGCPTARPVVPAAGLLLALLLGTCLLSATSAWARMLAIGEAAQPLTVTDLNGQTVELHDYLGDKALLVMFSSVGCAPCEASQPALREAASRFGTQVEIVCVMLSEERAVRRRLSRQPGVAGPRLLLDSLVEDVYATAQAYGVLGTPTTFLIDRDGTVVWRHIGRITLSTLIDGLDQALQS